MGYTIINETYNRHFMTLKQEFICDTDADFADLPPCCTGSSAVSLESGTVKVVNTHGEWVTFGEPSGGGSDSIVGTWQFNSTLNAGCPLNPAKINFTTNNNFTNSVGEDVGNSFLGMFTPYSTVLWFTYEGNDAGVSAIGMSGVANGFDGVVHITGGDDIANEEFVTWLKENATKTA